MAIIDSSDSDGESVSSPSYVTKTSQASTVNDNSEDEIVNVSVRLKKKTTRLESDSDSDKNSSLKPYSEVNKITATQSSVDLINKEENLENNIESRTKKRRIVQIGSDSDNESTNIKNKGSSSDTNESNKKLNQTESDNSVSELRSNVPTNKSNRVLKSKEKFKDILYNKLLKKNPKKVKQKENAGDKINHESDSDDNLSHKKDSGFSDNSLSSPNKRNLQQTKKNNSTDPFSNRDIYDAESSEDNNYSEPEQEQISNHNSIGDSKSKNKKEKKEKPAQRKSSSEALEKIHAETQRIIRESSVSLPYFLPKPRSIEEFLQKRESVPSISLRAKGECLGNFINLYEQRVKSIKESIYNSLSDEEETKEENVEEKANDSKDYQSDNKENSNSEKEESDINLVQEMEQKESNNVEIKVKTMEDNESKIKENTHNKPRLDTVQENVSNLEANGKYINGEKESSIIEAGDVDIQYDNSVDCIQNQSSNNSNEEYNNISDGTVNDINIDCTKTKVDESSNINIELHGDNSDTKVKLNEDKNNSSDCIEEKTNETNSDKQSQIENSERFSASELNIDSEVLMEPEFVNDKQNGSNQSSMDQDSAQKDDMKIPVKKKLFSNWSDSIKPPSDDEIESENKVTLILKGGQDMIELDDVVVAKNKLKPGVLKLMERYSKHVSTKPKHKHKSQNVSLNVITAEKDNDGNIINISNESLSIVLKDDGDEDSSKQNIAHCKPGAKLVKLKLELGKEMTKLREEAWKRRIEEAKMDEETYYGEKSDCKQVEFDEEEEIDEATTEEEEEEEYEVKEKHRRIKSAFVDEEAEVSDDGDNDADADDEDEDEDEEEEENDKEDDIEEEDSEKLLKEKYSPRSLKSKAKTFDMFLTQHSDADELECDDDEELPAYQLEMDTKERNMSTPAPDKVVFSPVVTLTGCDKAVGKNMETSFSSQINSPLQSPTVNHRSPKKLNFGGDDNDDLPPVGGIDNLLPTQIKSDDFDCLFSGKFPTQSLSARNLELNDDKCGYVTQTQGIPNGVNDLLSGNLKSSITNISQFCSGEFTSQRIDPKLLEDDVSCPNFITSQTQEQSPEDAPNNEVKSKMLNNSTVLSSDDDDVDTSMRRRNNVKRLRRLNYSDEEEESESTNEDDNKEKDVEEEGCINDASYLEDEPAGGEDKDEDGVEYDSEENEIINKVDQFFEAEAELSESEWDSADEDENDLDKMEQEEADNEFHDEEQLKEELGKIHMRQVLDDDNREVKKLQEILLEDGELHSDGPRRQRQFRWSNLADMSDLQMVHVSDESDVDDTYNATEQVKEDEVWRKARLERESYLEQEKNKIDVQESIIEESTSIELGKTVILNDIRNKVTKAERRVMATELEVTSPDSKLHAMMGLHMKRGSYLARGSQSLVRLAKITQGVGDEIDNKIVKKKGNFVFSSIDPTENDSNNSEEPKLEKVVVKRKNLVSLTPNSKKIKLNNNKAQGILSKLMSMD